MQFTGRVRLRGMLLAAGLLCASLPGVASGNPRAQAAGEQIPVAGTFSYPGRFIDTEPEIRGAVHAVQRIPGGTALYYSVGSPASMPFNRASVLPVPSLDVAYRSVDAATVALIDTQGLGFYQPMIGRDGCLCPELTDFGTKGGELYVGWAVMPPLPPGVAKVSVVFGFGNQVEDVPVGDGPLEPAVPTSPNVLGQGWPALPDSAALAGVTNPAQFVRPLVRHVADLEQRVSIAEQPGQVDESLAADVLFAVDSATLTPAAQATLAAVAARVKERAKGAVTVVGHTDSTGTPAYNAQLSLARARAVQAALQPGVGSGVTLTPTGVGERQPVADNATPEGRAQNRRVTVTYRIGGG